MSCDNDATRGFGPLVPGHLKVDFGDIDGLKKIFEGNRAAVENICGFLHVFACLQLLFVSEQGDRICGFLFEPIQGEAGVRIYHATSSISDGSD